MLNLVFKKYLKLKKLYKYNINDIKIIKLFLLILNIPT